jgi:hypothetical protein
MTAAESHSSIYDSTGEKQDTLLALHLSKLAPADFLLQIILPGTFMFDTTRQTVFSTTNQMLLT